MKLRLIGLIGLMAFMVSLATFAQPGKAQAALTLNNFIGFETNGLDEALGASGSPVTEASSPSPHSGDWSLDLASGSYRAAIITGGSIDSDNDFIVGFWINFADKVPGGTIIFMNARQDDNDPVWRLEITSSSNLRITDDGGSLIGSEVTDPFTVGQWHLIETRWQHSTSGAIDVHIDGSSVLSETAQDLSSGGSISADSADYQFLGNADLDLNIDDFYAYSGGTGTGDFLGDTEVFRYQANTNSTTADDLCSTGAGSTLDQGVWQDLGETPLSADGTEPGFTISAVRGGRINTEDTQSGDNFRHGPHGDTNIDGDSNIKGGKSLHRLRRENGSGTTHRSCLGNDVDSGHLSPTVTLTTGFANFFIVSSATEIPLSAQHFSVGMFKSAGGREIFGQEIWAFLLHVPDAPAPARRIFPVH